MGIDYYAVLGLTRSASDVDVKKEYRKLALKYHPDKNQEPIAPDKFRQTGEAYDVLSDAQRKAVYDQFGEEGLKNGIPTSNGEDVTWLPGYTFHGDPHKVFHDFFGGNNPFEVFFDGTHGDPSTGFGGLSGRGRKKQDPFIERDLVLSLEEIFHGCTKKMKISRRVMNEDGHTSSIRDKILTISVQKGWREGTRLTFPKEGDQGPNNIPADIVFVVRDKPHSRFNREGNNLVFVAKVLLGRALTGCSVDLPTVDGRLLSIPINDIISPGYEKIVPGEGMPIAQNPIMRGDLIIRFDIEFPRQLTSEKKFALKETLL